MAVNTAHLIVLVHACSAPFGPVYWRKLGEGQRAAIGPPRPFGNPHRTSAPQGAPSALLRENRQGFASWLLPGRHRGNLDRSALSRQWLVRNRSPWTSG